MCILCLSLINLSFVIGAPTENYSEHLRDIFSLASWNNKNDSENQVQLHILYVNFSSAPTFPLIG